MNNQLSHNALTIYLRNLRTLEFIKYQCEESVRKINNKKSYLESELNFKINNIPVNNVTEPYPPQTSDLIGKIVITLIITAAIIGLVWSLGVLLSIVGDIFDINTRFLATIAIVIVVIICIIYVRSSISEHKNDKEMYEKRLRDYQKSEIDYQNRLRNRNNDIIRLQNQVNILNTEAPKRITQINTYRYNIETMLKNAYNLNIIPKQFRDIYGVTYLYDFISTSGASGLGLSDAIINCNLEQIKYKLDKIIRQCDDIIRQQKNTNSNLREIQRQNNQLLNESKNISNNITLAKQYAEITAENSAVALELQKKQLAYQEVDFWLNNL